VNIFIGELTAMYTVIAIDYAAERNLQTLGGGSGNKDAVWNS
jgi:hypothetical protein